MRPLGSIYTHAGKRFHCSTCDQDGEKGGVYCYYPSSPGRRGIFHLEITGYVGQLKQSNGIRIILT